MISQRARYALRAIALSRKDHSMRIGDIAETQRIPRKFLEHIMLDLKRDGIVVSRRGKLGCYELLMRPDQITFGRILRLIDGPLAPLPCLSKTAYRRCRDCDSEATCELRRAFAKLADAARELLDKTTIADALGDQ
jgi:Rrf2 family protein